MTGTSGREMGEAMRAYQQHSAPAPAAPFGDRAIPARGQQPAFTRSPDSYQAWTGTGASPATDDVALQGRPVKSSLAVATRWHKPPPLAVPPSRRFPAAIGSGTYTAHLAARETSHNPSRAVSRIMTSMDEFEMPAIYPTTQSDHFETERLLVRRTVVNDLGSLRSTLEDPDLARLLGRDESLDPQAVINDADSGWEAHSAWTFTITVKATQHVVGFTGVSLEQREGRRGWQAEPVIAIAPDSRCQHYADEAMRGLIAWIFTDLDLPPDVMLDEVRAACVPDNDASIHLQQGLANVGMRDLDEQEVTVKHPRPGDPLTRPAHVFSISRQDYEQYTA